MSNIRNLTAAALSAAFHIILISQLVAMESIPKYPLSHSEGEKSIISVEMIIASMPAETSAEPEKEETPVRLITNKNALIKQPKVSSSRQTGKSASTKTQRALGKKQMTLKNILPPSLTTDPFNSHEGRRQALRQEGTNNGDITSKSTYLSRLRAKIENNKRYPTNGRNKQGVSIVSFRLSDNGQIHSVTLLKSSGYSILDNAAIMAVGQTSMAEAPPPEVPRVMSVSVYFTVH